MKDNFETREQQIPLSTTIEMNENKNGPKRTQQFVKRIKFKTKQSEYSILICVSHVRSVNNKLEA